MKKLVNISVIAVFGGALMACGGGGGGSSSGGGGPKPSAEVTASNALLAAQVATESVAEAGTATEEMEGVSDTLDSLSDSSGASALTVPSAQPVVVLECSSGSVTADVLSVSGASAIRYTADQCVDSVSGDEHDGVLVTTVGPWNEYSGGIETLLVVESDQFTSGSCTFEGGIGFRTWSSTPGATGTGTPADGTYHFVFEYGATSAGFSTNCNGNNVFLGPNSSVLHEVSWTVVGGIIQGNVTSTVSSGGIFEAPQTTGGTNGDNGDLLFEATDLVYDANDQDNNGFTDPGVTCPLSGTITVSGTGGSEVTVYFGTDTNVQGKAVQIVGPGINKNYDTCDDFLQDGII